MIDGGALHRAAIRVLVEPHVDEAEIRRGISTLYYGLFHALTAQGAALFAAGGPTLTFQAARAFSHQAMRKVCEAYVRAPSRPFPPPLDQLSAPAPNPRLTVLADMFVKLQEARHAADYDMAATFVRSDALDCMSQAEAAHWHLQDLQGTPELVVFLTALLLADRWSRRG